MPTFRLADEGLKRAHAVLARERARLRPLTGGDLVLTGGSSVRGALTGGDVDLHLRVEPGTFSLAVEALCDVYAVVHPEIWSSTLATFALPDEDVGIAVTPIGSVHDRRFRMAWERLTSDPGTLRAYNHMKRSHMHASVSDYRAAKAAFFDALERDR